MVQTFTSEAQWTEWLATLTWEPVPADQFKRLSRDEQLLRIRHSASHIMASALEKRYPGVQFATGPATAQGFFYDVALPQALKEEELADIQKEMETIAGRSQPFEYATVSKQDAIAYFEFRNQPHKIEVLQGIPSDTVTLYRHGQFIDLCAGPHVPHTGICRHVKLLTLSAVHWKGEDIPSLTRVGGTAWTKESELKRYMEFLEESKARDHRNLGPQLDLFSFHPWAAAPLWHPHGVTLRNTLMTLWRDMIDEDYIEIFNPLLYKKELYECSGHWDHYQENMFIFRDNEGEADFALKPMNCPDTMLYFRSQVRSYKELPLRIAEGQILHRNEVTGALHGLMRTRMFVQDDAHLFVAPEHVEAEVTALMNLLEQTYALFDLQYEVNLSTRPEDFMGDPAVWDKAEAALKEALTHILEPKGRTFAIDEGGGAFYGPKIDIKITDSLGRKWQCGTIQLDFQLPERFELKYIAADGSQQRPIVIHRAIFGSFERFIGILIEHLGGAFPTWLAPQQAVVLPIAERHADYAKTVAKTLKKAGIRVAVNDTESLNYRIRQSEMAKIPYLLVVGDREAEQGTVAVRKAHGGPQVVKPLAELIDELKDVIEARTFDVTVKRFNELFDSKSGLSTESELY